MRNVVAKSKKTASNKKTKQKQIIKSNTRVKTAKKEPVIKTKKPSKNLVKKPVEEMLINENIDFCDTKLDARQFIFLTYYLTPGQPCFHKAERAAIKAGYAESTARVDAFRMIHKPEIEKIIKANDKLAQLALQEATNRAIEIKKQRAFYDPLDYFTEETKETKFGVKKAVALKPLEEMTEEQRMCIDGMDVKGQTSIPIYLMPDRERELNDLIKMNAEQQKAIGDVEEEPWEAILERITIRERKRAQYPAGYEDEIVERPESNRSL